MFGGNFAPRGWAFCDGQLLPIANYNALFSILGTTYGGDGRTTFGLPDLRGRVAMHPGSGPGLTQRRLGEKAGQESVSLSTNQMPAHSHIANMKVADSNGSLDKATNNAFGKNTGGSENIYAPASYTTGKMMADGTVTTNNTGSSQGHNNMQPYQCVNYIIALEGTYPSRS